MYLNGGYNVTMRVTKCKHLPFDAGKAAYFERLCLQNSLRGSLTVLLQNKNLFKLSKHKCLLPLLKKHYSYKTERASITEFLTLSIS